MGTLIRVTTKLLGLSGALLLLAAPAAAGGAGSGQCSGPRPPPAVDAEVNAFIEQVRREHAAAGAPEDGETVVLNNRGYNYGPARSSDLDHIRAELTRPR